MLLIISKAISLVSRLALIILLILLMPLASLAADRQYGSVTVSEV